MKASVILGTLACVCSICLAMPASANNFAPDAQGLDEAKLQALKAEPAVASATAAAHPEITRTAAAAPEGKTKIGITLPTQNIERFYKGGQFLKQAFEAEGYEAALYYGGDNNLEIQQRQITRMINEGCKVIIVGAVDCYGLGKQLDEARAAGVKIVAYGSLLMNTDAVDYLVAFNERRVGEIQGNYLRSALELDQATAQNPKYIEVFSGVEHDSSSRVMFDGAMSVLKPYLNSGALVVRSGVTDFEGATVGESDENAIKRMDTLIAEQKYSPESGNRLDGILSPSDIASSGIIAALARAGYTSETMPRITGQDCSAMGVRNIENGLQGMSVFKDGRVLANSAVRMTAAILDGDQVRITEPGLDNGCRQVPAYECEPVQVADGQYADIMIKNGLLTRNEIENAY